MRPIRFAGWAAFVGRPHDWEAWGRLLGSVTSGENAFRSLHGVDVWTYRSGHPEENAAFDWDDEEAAAAILRTCRRAIGAGGTLLVVERVVGPPNEGAETKFSDLNMLVMPGGRERGLQEFEALFESAGFRLEHETPTSSGFSVIAATPARAG